MGVGSVDRRVLSLRKFVLKGLADNRVVGLATGLSLEVSMIGVQTGEAIVIC